MELVAYGAQDIYLTGNPQITFFKVVYRRHTNFSMESIQQTWLGTECIIANAATPNPTKCEAIIERNGDLINQMYLELKLDKDEDIATDYPTSNLTSMLIESAELQIGGQRIDKHSGTWLEIWSELTQPNHDGRVGSYQYNDGTAFQNMSGMGGVSARTNNNNTKTNTIYHVPLQFYFCRNPGLSLPLIALQYHEVKIILKHAYNNGIHKFNSNKLWCDYIYLDTDERRRFAQVSHEYLIEQVQEQLVGTANITNETLNFNHPVKELIWCNMHGSGVIPNTQGYLSSVNTDHFLKLVLNGSDRFKERDCKYFTRTQVYQHHSGGAVNSHGRSSAGFRAESSSGKLLDAIGVYSFALKPEEHQPSGTCNFSRIDSAQLQKTSGTTAFTHIFAVNYNVLRIMSGMGGLAYSN